MSRVARLLLILGGLGVGTISFLLLGGQIEAQDPQTAALRYAQSLLLTPEDVPGHDPGVVRPARTAPGLLAYSGVFLQKSGAGVPAGAGLFTELLVFETNFAARAEVESLRDRVRNGQNGPVVGGPYVVTLPGVEDGYQYMLQSPFADYGRGVVFWRRANVVFWLVVYHRPPADARTEGLRVAGIWNAKAERIGPFGASGQAGAPTRPPATLVPATATPEPTPTPTPSPPTPGPSGTPVERRPDMTVLVTARVSGTLVPDDTPITAVIGGKECGSAVMRQGFAVLTVAGGDPQSGCGVPGATITFRIAETTANESLPWNEEVLAGLVELSTPSPLVGGGLLRRPMLQRTCGDVAMPCSPEERALWAGDRAAWQAQLAATEGDTSPAALLRAWMQSRASRGEAFSNLVLSVQDGRPFTFILAVRHSPTAAEPEPYVSVLNLGADRQVGGWKLRTGTDQVYTFSAGTVLGQGFCRIYAKPLDTPESGPACGSAAFPPPGAELPVNGGYVELLDEQGNFIDAVAW